MNARVKAKAPVPSQREIRIILKTDERIVLDSPSDRTKRDVLLPSDGEVDAIYYPTGTGTEPWIVIPSKQFCGKSRKRWIEYWENTQIEIWKRTETGWEPIDNEGDV